MPSVRVPSGRNMADRAAAEVHRPKILADRPNAGLLEGELLDLYGAILIVVPIALFLKSLWA
jgi:hypothetical protein